VSSSCDRVERAYRVERALLPAAFDLDFDLAVVLDFALVLALDFALVLALRTPAED
jgi:hypothetical protein